MKRMFFDDESDAKESYRGINRPRNVTRETTKRERERERLLRSMQMLVELVVPRDNFLLILSPPPSE